ncbi:MAG: Gfo/Idh/MocA family oxidoreductase [Euryarchaeota archaeon]|nr:Gfo/Idh/MocA family oxidoreductase [Euryarchaeota archaeon]
MNVGIVGAGLVGKKRAKALEGLDVKLLSVADVVEELAKSLANQYNCKYTTDWKELVKDDSIDIVFVSTIHESLAEITIEAIKKGKHVLVEKPVARNSKELSKVLKAAKDKNVKIQVGYNHRFHPAIIAAKKIIESGEIGPLMFIRGRYGHGGRKNYHNEWRAFKNTAGGGELLDQGSHLIDLSRLFMGNFSSAIGYAETFFWDMEVEDNCFVLLRNNNGQIASLHASWTQWKNTFSFEIFGKIGQLNIDGLGGSYGTETLTFYKMKPEFGIPDKQVFEFPGEDLSWKLEFENLLDAIKKDTPINGTLEDAYEAMKIIEKIYRWSEQHKSA